jgi:hypothetical protein
LVSTASHGVQCCCARNADPTAGGNVVARCARAENVLPGAGFRAFRRTALLLAAPTCAALTLRKRCARAEIALLGAEQGKRVWAPWLGCAPVRFPYGYAYQIKVTNASWLHLSGIVVHMFLYREVPAPWLRKCWAGPSREAHTHGSSAGPPPSTFVADPKAPPPTRHYAFINEGTCVVTNHAVYARQ